MSEILNRHGTIASTRDTIRRFLALEDGVEGLRASVVTLADSTETLKASIAELNAKAAELPRSTWRRRLSDWWSR